MSTQQNSSQSVTGLATTTLTAANTDIYNIVVTLQAPNLVPTPTAGAGGGAGTGSGGGAQVNSAVVITINQNGSPVLVSSAGARGLTMAGQATTAGDIYTVVLSSSLAQDKQLNAVQATISLSQGPI